jgi:hypothetical protein
LARSSSRRRRQQVVPERHTDDLPKTGLFTEPVRIARLDALEPDVLDDGSQRVVFLAEIRDADDKRCSDLAVEATVTGPERSGTVQGTTDLLGRIRFRMAGPAGSYRIVVTDVAAGGLSWDPSAGPREATTELV